MVLGLSVAMFTSTKLRHCLLTSLIVFTATLSRKPFTRLAMKAFGKSVND